MADWFWTHRGPAEVPYRGKIAFIRNAPEYIACPVCHGRLYPVLSGELAFFDVRCDGCKLMDHGKFLRPARIADWSWEVMKEFHEKSSN